MTPLYGLVFAVIATVLCWAGVSVWRAARTWLTARALRQRGDGDTVEIVRRRPLVDLAGHVVLVLMLAVPAAVLAGGGALPGPSAGGSVGLPTIGGTMTGLQVMCAATDFSTCLDEDLTLSPAGTGQVDITTPIKNSAGTSLDIREALTTGKTDTCNGISGSEGEFCILPAAGEGLTLSNTSGNIFQRIWALSSGSAFFQLVPNGTDKGAYMGVYDSAAGSIRGIFGYYGSTYSDADIADKIIQYSVGKVISLVRDDAVAAGTVVMEVRDNAGASGVQLMTVDGAGNIKLDSGATRTRGTITLAAGTGTATVASGSICVCTDTTANASVRCAVATTTLTATGTGTDVISYICL